MDRLVSKIIAGGLSAGVFLFWWPDHVAGEGLLQLVMRGLLWTLSFELLLLTLGPAERLVERHLRQRAIARGDRVKDRLAVLPEPARTGGVVALAFCGLAAPIALLADAPTELVKDDTPRVVKQVIVERPVIEKKVVVRKVVAPAAQQPLQSAGASPSVGTSQVARPVARKAAAKVAPERTAAKPRTTETTTATKTADAPTVKKQTTAAPTTNASAIGTPAAGTQSGDAAPAATTPQP